MNDPNADLIGYEMEFQEFQGDPPTRWRVTGTDPVLGSNYVQIKRTDDVVMRVQTAATIRRRKQIEAGA